MSNRKLVQRVAKLSKKVGKAEIRVRLVALGVSPITASRICRGKYECTPKELLARALRTVLDAEGAKNEQAS